MFKSKKKLISECLGLQKSNRIIYDQKQDLVRLCNNWMRRSAKLVKENEELKRREETLLKVIDKQIDIKCMLSTKLVAAESKLDKLEKYISEMEGR